MSQEEPARRKSVKRTGTRFTVDMRKELDTLMADCYGDPEVSETISTMESAATVDSDYPKSSNPSMDEPHQQSVGSSNHIALQESAPIPISQEPASLPDQPASPQTTPQDILSVSPQAKEVQQDTTTSPRISPPTPQRKLVYSRSQNKLTSPNLSVDGNGRSSNPIPVDANYGKGKPENQPTPDSEKQSNEGSALERPLVSKPEPIKKGRTMPDLKIDSMADKKPTSSSGPSSPAGTEVKARQSLFFEHASTKIGRAAIIATNTENGPQGAYTVYVMEILSESGQVMQNVSKRFKNFSDLVEKLKERAPELAGMLPHRVILGNMAAKLVSHRKVQLQALLDYILGHKELSRSVEVLAFFRNPTLLKQLASKPDIEGFLNRGLYGTLGVKFIQMWASLKRPCLYFWQSQSETAELKSAVVLRWLTVEISDETTFTIELRPWQHVLFASDPQSRPIVIRVGSKEEMISWAQALHIAKAAVNDVIMLKKTMLQEEDAEVELGDDEEETPLAAESPPKIPPLALSGSTDTLKSSPLVSPRKSSLTKSSASESASAPVSPRTAEAIHRNRNQTQPHTVQSPPKLVTRSNTESQLTAPRKISEPPAVRYSTPVSKLKDFVENPDIPSLSRFEARMALMKEPPKYPPPSPGKLPPKRPERNPLLLTSHLPSLDTEENILLSSTKQQYIRAASANKLFEKVIDHTFTGTEYLDLVSAFLIGYRTFASPNELLDKLIQAFHASGTSNSIRKSSGSTLEGSTTRLCICNFISKWVDFHLHDFSDANLVNKLITFLDSNMQPHVPHNERTAIEKVRTTIKKKTRDVIAPVEENLPPSILPPLFTILCSGGFDIPFLVMDFDKVEIARHLCILEFEAFSKILPTECLGQAWNKKNKETKAPNITAIIKRFNEVSCWISSVLVTTEDLKARTAVLARFIEIADECRQFNNFNSVVAIVSGLESSAVHRLKKTWAGLPPPVAETFEQLKSLMTTEKNYLTYRNVVKLANPPCIPYLGVFLTDLVFIDEAPDVIQPHGLINFDKWYRVAWVVREIRKFQVTHYPFRSSAEVLRTLNNLPVLPENEIYSLSMKCEERAK